MMDDISVSGTLHDGRYIRILHGRFPPQRAPHLRTDPVGDGGGFGGRRRRLLHTRRPGRQMGILQQGDQQRHAAPGHNHPALLSRARRSHGTPQRMGPRLPNHPVSIMLR